MPLNGAIFRRVTKPGSATFAAIVALYSRSFPPSERKPAAFFASALSRPDYRLFSLERGKALLGFALVYQSPSEELALLEYMAVTEQERGSGRGERLFRALVGRSAHPLLIEVETGRADAWPGDDRTRRRLFYRRLGCRAIDGLHYLMPKVGSADPPPMELMVHGFAPAAVRRHRVRHWLGEIYSNVYGRSVDDSAIEQMLAGLPELIPLK